MGIPYYKTFLSEVQPFIVSKSVWDSEDVGTYTKSSQSLRRFFNGDTPFSTPKPEPLIERILTLCTKENDLVLDSFAGSGTTGVVASKMNRNWIMIEQTDSVEKFIEPRLNNINVNFKKLGVDNGNMEY